MVLGIPSATVPPAKGRPVKGRGSAWKGVRRLKNVDGRCAGARRFRDLTRAYGEALGGLDRLTEPELALVRQAAAVTVQCEALQVAIAKGEPVSTDELIRLSSEARRLTAAVRQKEAPKPKTLADHLAAKRGAAA